MALPKFQDFLYPFLKKLEDGKDVTSKEMKSFLIEHFELTQDDCSLKTLKSATYWVSWDFTCETTKNHFIVHNPCTTETSQTQNPLTP